MVRAPSGSERAERQARPGVQAGSISQGTRTQLPGASQPRPAGSTEKEIYDIWRIHTNNNDKNNANDN